MEIRLLPFRSALNQKKAEEKNIYGAIDYDAPIASEPSKIGLGTKVSTSRIIYIFHTMNGVLFSIFIG